jgi:hypothetical protein
LLLSLHFVNFIFLDETARTESGLVRRLLKLLSFLAEGCQSFSQALLLGFGLFIAMPLLFFFACGLAMWCTYQVGKYFWEIGEQGFMWLKDRLMLPCIFTGLGFCVALCGGWQAGVVAATAGFVFGCMFAASADEQYAPHGQRKRSGPSWLGLPYEEDTGSVWGAWNGPTNNNYNPQPARKTYEKPWCWKGFQTSEGPKEDEVRMDKAA